MSEKLKNKDYFTPNEVAQWMMVSPVTVRGWAQRDLLQAEVTPGGHRRFRREEVERFARQWNPNGNKGPLRVLIEGHHPPITVETANDGFDAGRKIYSFQPDVVLLDLKMPGLSGTDVCKKIKDHPGHANIRVIGMSGYLSPESEAELIAAGAECCMTKPIDVERLLAQIDSRTSSVNVKSDD